MDIAMLGSHRLNGANVVIQCAGRKHPAATLSLNGAPVDFVAAPPGLPSGSSAPWDCVSAASGRTFVDCVRDYNDRRGSLLPADAVAGVSVSGSAALTKVMALYKPPIYQRLQNEFGAANAYVLSAGWGLLRACDAIPTYNVSFSHAGVHPEARVTPADRAKHDTVRRTICGTEDIHLFLTPAYLRYWEILFPVGGTRRVILHWRKGQALPRGLHGSYDVVEHDCGGGKTNWQYTAAKQCCPAQGVGDEGDAESADVASTSRERPSPIGAMTRAGVYVRVWRWYTKNVGLIKPNGTVYLPALSSSPVRLLDADKARELIGQLPKPDVVTDAEIFAVMREVLMGRLEWAFHASDGTTKMSAYAKTVLGDDRSQWMASAADKATLRSSPVHAWLSDHLK